MDAIQPTRCTLQQGPDQYDLALSGGSYTQTNICPGWIVPEDEKDVGGDSFWKRFGVDMMGTPDQMQAALKGGTLWNMSGLETGDRCRSCQRRENSIANHALRQVLARG
jgi:hypothetical protein